MKVRFLGSRKTGRGAPSARRSTTLLIRGLLAAATLTVATAAPARARSVAATSTIYFYTISDTNVADLWSGTLLPDFEKAYPQYTVKFVNLLHGNGAQGLVDRVIAARAAGKPSVALDLFEDTPVNYNFPSGKRASDYFTTLNTGNVPNARLIDPSIAAQGQGLGIAYRASAVTLAYDSAHVSNPPTTYDGIIAWVKAHPGKFTYCRPEDGGSGDAFVARALLNNMDPRALSQPYNPAAEKGWPRGWALLRSIEPDLYKGGFHPAGNTPVLNLLGRSAIWMATAWSDQGLQAHDQGLLPPTIRFTQINPPFTGGPAFMSVPSNAQNRAGALALLNFVLRPAEQAKIGLAIEGFPGIQFKYMPANVASHFGPLVRGYSFWPGAQWDADLAKQWAANVPTGR